MTMTKRYYAERGSYQGTTDDRMDRWYIGDRESTVADRRGPGYRTRRECEEEIARRGLDEVRVGEELRFVVARGEDADEWSREGTLEDAEAEAARMYHGEEEVSIWRTADYDGPQMARGPVQRYAATAEADIRTLLTEAGASGDYGQVVLCLEALDEDDGRFGDVARVGHRRALLECARAIADAR